MTKHMSDGSKNDERDLGGSSEGSTRDAHVSVVQDPNDPDMVIIRTRKRERRRSRSSRRKMNPALRTLLVVLGVVVGVLCAVGIALGIAVWRGNVNLHKVFNPDEATIEKANVRTEDRGQVVEYKGHTYRYNDDVVSFVVIGHDDESASGFGDRSLADTIVLFTIDTSTNKVRATVVPRNTWCEVDLFDDDGTYLTTNEMQITLSHGVTLPTQGECAANTVKSVSRIFYNMPVGYYFDFGADVVANATLAVNGVQLEALETIPGTDYVAGDTVILEGDAAYRYVAYRETDVDESALARQERQIQFIRAFASKVAGMGPQGLLSVYNGVSGDIVTNLGISEVAYFASCFARGDNAQLEIAALKGETRVAMEADGIEYERYYLDEDSVMENTLAAFYTQID